MGINIIGKYKKNQMILVIASIIFFSISHLLNLKTNVPIIEINKQDTALNIKPLFLTAFSFGNKRLFSDIIWIQTLIESDLEHYKAKDLNNWLYLRFNTISHLDPLFYENYLYGGQYLSIIKDDMGAASSIYEKGLLIYPLDYALNYNAGLNYYYEMGNYKKGLEKLEQIKNHPKAPDFLASIVNKLQLELSFDYSAALLFLKERLRTAKDELVMNRLKQDIYAIKAERDLECLNSSKNNCERFDYNDQPYIFKNNKYHSAQPFSTYRLRKKKTP